jgi:hypothetical protein
LGIISSSELREIPDPNSIPSLLEELNLVTNLLGTFFSFNKYGTSLDYELKLGSVYVWISSYMVSWAK